MKVALLFAVLVVAAPARAEVVATGYIDNNVAGDVQSGRVGAGVSAGYYLRRRIGFEVDGELHGHFSATRTSPNSPRAASTSTLAPLSCRATSWLRTACRALRRAAGARTRPAGLA